MGVGKLFYDAHINLAFCFLSCFLFVYCPSFYLPFHFCLFTDGVFFSDYNFFFLTLHIFYMIVQQVSLGWTLCLILSLVSVWSSPLCDMSVCPLLISATAVFRIKC